MFIDMESINLTIAIDDLDCSILLLDWAWLLKEPLKPIFIQPFRRLVFL